MIIIPHQSLDPATLQSLIEDFVTRDGAIQGHADTELSDQVAMVQQQLESNRVAIIFDEVEEACSIVPTELLGQPNPANSELASDSDPD